jgi:hypothetical protein
LGAGLDWRELQTEEKSLTVGPGRYDEIVGYVGATTLGAVDVACNVALWNNVVENDKSNVGNVGREEKTEKRRSLPAHGKRKRRAPMFAGGETCDAIVYRID